METAGFGVLAILCLFFQMSLSVPTEKPSCVPGFDSDFVTFKVTRRHLGRGTLLGKVRFSDCTDRKRFPFHSDDQRFTLQTDGVVKVKRTISLHEGHVDFHVYSWDLLGRKISIPARVLYEDPQQHHSEEDSSKREMPVPVLYFSQSGPGLSRRKRDWVIPPINIPENHRGPYPYEIAHIRSNEDKIKKIHYSISGPGASEEPVGLFIIDRDSGRLYITQALDRELKDKYIIQAHAVTDGGQAEAPIDIIVKVLDQNDNRPQFTQDTFWGEVPEASPQGFKVIKVEATDDDEPGNDNSDIRYRIMKQEPQLPSNPMFLINPLTGVIRVSAGGIDRAKYSEYILEVQATDMKGEGIVGRATVNLTVTDRNDNAPVFTQSSYEASVPENKVDAVVIILSVTDGDEPHSAAWNAKFNIVDGDPEELFIIKTGSNKHEGIIFTAKGLDFERSQQHTLLVVVENDIPFATPLPTATATVTVNVEDLPPL